MSYNWKCCSFYPNNFDASALTMRIRYFCASHIFLNILALRRCSGALRSMNINFPREARINDN